MTRLLFLVCALLMAFGVSAQTENINKNPFRQLYMELPTPNVYRNAAGAPGHQYWQQKADYVMDVRLDDATQRIYGTSTITYHNNSPDVLDYLWLQLDQNVRALDSDTYKTGTSNMSERMTLGALARLEPTFDGGFKIDYVQSVEGKPMEYTIERTMMRVELAQPLKPGEKVQLKLKWWYNINNRLTDGGGRSGSEYFEKDDNFLYTIAQFYPRMALYIDNEGWQNKQFLGSGEFTLTFGDYDVKITVPTDHLVAATGTLQNPNTVLTKQQRDRLEMAKKEFVQPVIIASQEEAVEREKTKLTKEQTWHFKAENVRDFAFASSRKFIWDAMAVKQEDGSTTMAMSMYPKEGNPLWERFSTKAVAHTLKWYSHYTFAYPYPVAWSINAADIGMEYPMICFNFGRVEEDGTYSDRTKYGMIGVIIHEVGHNYFPMIVNSDERQWTWMDEGLNTFLQYLTEQQWERNYPSRRGPADKIVDYMKGDKAFISPIMTNSESIWQFGNNAYGKPATALNILRETIMGREQFDYAFKQYANRWKFKHPAPADLFRTMEDASAIDLDWFWRGWFFTTDHTDIALSKVTPFRVNSRNPEKENALAKQRQAEGPRNISDIRNEEIAQTYDEQDPSLKDFYTDYDPLKATVLDQEEYQSYLKGLSEAERAVLDADKYYYELTFENLGGLVMPIILEFTFADGTTEVQKIPAEIWRRDYKKVSKVFPFAKEVTAIELDPFLETADTDRSNNYYPSQSEETRFELFQSRQRGAGENPMQRDRRAKEKEGSNR
ncbi:M1 family metallopeptidase [Neolewinella lacunae]|uniref:M1 family metallopeptidase n=1 Tax=Neolewinella lacunae TaxID=1517758 RepID=A0A923TEE6_9BACT|nr:M1 family metallopeptidase [Neolewinella lacunae]MBC6995832.1 M1 family metallopeptidase [Neolewinella lacunae]MDN3636475.1 M1 family metallopeptidase [Neolewinella lacunae]